MSIQNLSDFAAILAALKDRHPRERDLDRLATIATTIWRAGLYGRDASGRLVLAPVEAAHV